MKEKLTHTLPQIRVSEETRKLLEEAAASSGERRSLTSLLQNIVEDVAAFYKKNGRIPPTKF